MHEYSITSSIIEILEEIGRKNKLDRIKKVNFRISPVASIEPESVRFYYEYLTQENNLLKGAELVFEKSNVTIICRACKKTFENKVFSPICPGCGSSNVMVKELDDLKIVSVEA